MTTNGIFSWMPGRRYQQFTNMHKPLALKLGSTDSFLAKQKKLYTHYENSFLYLPDEKTNAVEWMRRRYTKTEYYNTSELLQWHTYLDDLVESIVGDVTVDDLDKFFSGSLTVEIENVNKGDLCAEYQEIAESESSARICKYILSQWCLDYLTEASPLSKTIAGNFGEWQTNIFKIIQDEYGSGEFQNKHSTLFEKTLRSLDMPDSIDSYRKDIIGSVYFYMNHVNRLCSDKSLFFRFLGFLYIYEAGLIDETRQQGMLLRQVFNDAVDTQYFDLHVEVDQGHGRFVLDEIILPVLHKYDNDVAREVMIGYVQSMLILDYVDWEIDLKMGSIAKLEEESVFG